MSDYNGYNNAEEWTRAQNFWSVAALSITPRP
jgi:hypothetical protein